MTQTHLMAGVPNKPGDIKLLRNKMSWGRPENTVQDVPMPLEYIVVVVDTTDDSTDGSPFITEVCRHCSYTLTLTVV